MGGIVQRGWAHLGAGGDSGGVSRAELRQLQGREPWEGTWVGAIGSGRTVPEGSTVHKGSETKPWSPSGLWILCSTPSQLHSYVTDSGA